MMKRVWRAVRRIAMVGLPVLLILLVLVQWQQWVLRHRAERLLADLQSVRLNETGWPEMQRLMTRWGAWGRYEGTCTAVECRYEVTVEDRASWLMEVSDPSVFRRVSAAGYLLLGGRIMTMRVRLAMQDGAIRRESLMLMLHVLKRSGEYELIVRTRNAESMWGQVAPYRQLAEHPNYLAGKPGGCTFCVMGILTFRPEMDQDEVRRLTAFDLSCVTRWHPCTTLGELMPVGRQWWPESDEEYRAYEKKKEQSPASTMCNVPEWARMRDADLLLRGQIRSIKVRTENQETHRVIEFHVDSLAKGKGAWVAGKTVLVREYAGAGWPNERATPLQVGKRYLLMANGDAQETAVVDAEPCDWLDETPKVMVELSKEAASPDQVYEEERWVNSVPL